MQSGSEEPAPQADKMPPPSLGALILAAGQSNRFWGGHKLLAPFRGQPLIWSVINTVAGANVSETIVVTNEDVALAVTRTANLSAYRVVIQNPSAGMAVSLKAGLLALRPCCSGAMIFLADMPLVSRALSNSLISVYQDYGGTKIVFPSNSVGENGHPIIWPRRFFSQLMSLQGDLGGKALLDKNKSCSISIRVDTDEAFVDVDTREDYERLIQR